ncbi:MAG: hypothetical protein HY861_01005 [Chlamydiia bacterium]|nr:hypothetical protein [Chlamydiia bacterium]
MFFEQTFSLIDIPRVALLAFLEVLLSADNAIVLGLISQALPYTLRKRALYIGAFSAFFFRAMGVLAAAYLLEYPWIQWCGGAYLLYLSCRHFLKQNSGKPTNPQKHLSFWKTVFLIEFFDLAFAVDSIVAGVAFIGPTPQGALVHPKLWIVYLGGMLGVLCIRYAAQLLSILITKYPRLESSAYLMIGWIGLKLGVTSLLPSFPALPLIFWSVLALLLLYGLNKPKQPR